MELQRFRLGGAYGTKLGPGESMVFGMSSLLDCEMFYDGQIDPDAVYELTIFQVVFLDARL